METLRTLGWGLWNCLGVCGCYTSAEIWTKLSVLHTRTEIWSGRTQKQCFIENCQGNYTIQFLLFCLGVLLGFFYGWLRSLVVVSCLSVLPGLLGAVWPTWTALRSGREVKTSSRSERVVGLARRLLQIKAESSPKIHPAWQMVWFNHGHSTFKVLV